MRWTCCSGSRALAALGAALAAGACSPVEPQARIDTPATTRAAGQPLASEALLVLHDVMEWVVDPASDVVFAAAGQRAPTDRHPATAEAWQAVADAAERLLEQAELLAQPALASNRADWLRQATAMRHSAAAVMGAARQHDAERVAQASDALWASCQGCHLHHADTAGRHSPPAVSD